MDKSRKSQPAFSKLPFAFSDSLLGSIDITTTTSFHTKSPFLDDRPPKTEPPIDHRLSRTNTYTHTSSNKRNMLSRAVRAIPGRALVAVSLRPAVVPTTRQIAPLVTPVIRRKYHEKVLDRTWPVLSSLVRSLC